MLLKSIFVVSLPNLIHPGGVNWVLPADFELALFLLHDQALDLFVHDDLVENLFEVALELEGNTERVAIDLNQVGQDLPPLSEGNSKKHFVLPDEDIEKHHLLFDTLGLVLAELSIKKTIAFERKSSQSSRQSTFGAELDRLAQIFMMAIPALKLSVEIVELKSHSVILPLRYILTRLDDVFEKILIL